MRASAGNLHVDVSSPVLQAAADQAAAVLLADGVPAALSAGTPMLWGSAATAESTIRLGWLDLPTESAALPPRIAALRTDLTAEGVDRVVLAGMGGSSLAPEVICAAAGVPLVVLDTTDPGQVQAALTDLPRTVVVVSSKSGGTLETDSHYRAFRAAFTAAGIDPAQRIVVVTDPGSPLAATAAADGVREIFEADPHVGGRYSALTAFGLVPAGLAGADTGALLAHAAAVRGSLGADAGVSGDPALLLGAVLGGGAAAGRDKLVLASATGLPGFGDWAEQLVAESTGKEGRGLLPVVVESLTAPGTAPTADTQLAVLSDEHATGGAGAALPDAASAVSGPLGAQFWVWEAATALAGRVLGINPFDQPNVQESKDNTKALLDAHPDGDLPTGQPLAVVDGVEVYADAALLPAGTLPDLEAVLRAVGAAVPERGYLAVMAYLDRSADARVAGLRPYLARAGAYPVTFGWAPRFLHSTGQYHKGGPQTGVFVQVTGVPRTDVAIPGRPFSFARLQMAQALGDLSALRARGRPAVRLHLQDRDRGVAALLAAAATVAG